MDSTFTMPLPDKFSSKDCAFSVNFTCQRCCQPLKLHSSFSELDHQTLSELSVPLYPNEDSEDERAIINSFQNQRDESSIMRKIVLPVKFADAGSDFMVVDDLSNLPLDNNQSFKVTTALFNIMSDQSDVDHPICEECCDNLLDQMDDNLRMSEEDHKDYREFQAKLEMLQDEDDDLEEQKTELVKLQERVAQLQLELSVTETEQTEMRDILKASKEEYEALQSEEDKRHQDYCRIQRQYLLLEDSHRSAKNQMACAQAQLDKLKYTNVFNSTFHIWHSGHFATINGFRMGRLPNVPVQWSEINAAWGQTVLLLHCLARKVGLTFERYRLVPYGNQSYLEALVVDKSNGDLPLYCIGGVRYLFNYKFDMAMAAFLDCLQQFKEKVESEAAKMAVNNSKSFHLPYKMDKGKIEDSNKKTYSIKAQFNSEEQWTKALKFMLTNLKWALAWVSSQSQFSSSQDHS